MKNKLHLTCPICSSADSKTIVQIDCGNLDKSTLYPIVSIKHCLLCGHFFNELTAEELVGLDLYYNDEYAPANLGITDKTGDRPGSAGTLTTQRYDQLYQALSPHINVRQSILDVGCALGGFLDYISDKGFSELAGVDMTRAYVDQARLKNRYRIEIGNAQSLPFGNQTFDVIVMEQVMEHLFSPGNAFQEARRVLKNGGIFCIGVPDAARYADHYFFDFYWLLLREHIQHFDIAHLSILGIQMGFVLLDCRETVHAIMTEEMLMPNIYAVFRRTDSVTTNDPSAIDRFKLKQKMDVYLVQEQERQSVKRRKIEALIQSQQPVYVWGIGREFLYLHESAGLKHCRIAGLIDANPFKQLSCTVSGRKISKAEDLLPGASADSVLIITAIAHTNTIKATAKELQFKGKVLDLL